MGYSLESSLRWRLAYRTVIRKSGRGAVSTVIVADPMGSSKAEIALQSCPRLGQKD